MSSAPHQLIDISIVIAAHDEGRLAHRTMRSVQAAMEVAEQAGLACEIVIVLAQPTLETQTYFELWRDKAQVLNVNCGDVNLARNAACAAASGQYITLLGATELMGSEWLHLAYARASQVTLADYVIHAEYSLEFNGRSELKQHLSSRAPLCRPADMLFASFWTGGLLTLRATFLKYPFHAIPESAGFGYGVQHWISLVLAGGGEVLIAPKTVVFVRKAVATVAVRSRRSRATLYPPSPLFDPRQCSQRPAGVGDALAGNAEARKGSADATSPALSFPQRVALATQRFPLVKKSLGKVYRSIVGEGIQGTAVPNWIMQQWFKVAQIEPLLFPDKEHLERTDTFTYQASPLASAYLQICSLLSNRLGDATDPQFTHVYLLAWLNRGGGDLEALNLILMVASNPANRVLVIATDGANSPWKSRLPQSVCFIDIWNATHELPFKDREHLLAQLLVQLQPRVIQLVHSMLGIHVFQHYAQSLSQFSKLFVPGWCADVDPEGKLVGFAVHEFPQCAEYISGMIADNNYLLKYLEKTFAIDLAKLFLLYQPISLKREPAHPTKGTAGIMKVLWAARLDRQKRPDLLLKIAQRCQADDIHFHVYGSSLVPWDGANVDFRNLPNVTFGGNFDGLSSLQPELFDVFLNTSQWEGLPNILLEAIAVGLPIVTSDAGGIPELIEHDKTGLLVSPFDDIDQYVISLRRLSESVELRQRLVRESLQLIRQRHSWEKFSEQLNKVPGYCVHECQLARAELSLLEAPVPEMSNWS